MAWTTNIPQETQTIAFTQPLLQANANFLETGIGKEHNFDASGTGSNMYHLQSSMPNQALLAAFPVGAGFVDGCYYVSGGIAYYYDGTLNYPLSPFCVRAAINFDGTTASPTIRSSFNVASITKPGTGSFVITFTTAMPSANYCASITGMGTSRDLFGSVNDSSTNSSSVTTTVLKVVFTDSSNNRTSPIMGNVIVFGG